MRLKSCVIISVYLLMMNFSQITYSQNWAPIGAIWHYNYCGSSYSTFESVDDTIINGIICKKIVKSKPYHYDYWGSRPLIEYTYYSNDSVYYWDMNLSEFKLLYCFNANPGDTWDYSYEGYSYFGDRDTIRTTVDSVDFVTINSVVLKRLYVHYSPISFEDGFIYTVLDTTGVIIEFIGDTKFMWNIYAMDEIIFDSCLPFGLRCYADSNIGFYETGIVDSCNYVNVLSIPKTIDHTELYVEVFPNPTTGILNLSTNGNSCSEVELYNLQGELINSLKVEPNNSYLKLDISYLEVGVYVLRVIENGDVVLTEKILKE